MHRVAAILAAVPLFLTLATAAEEPRQTRSEAPALQAATSDPERGRVEWQRFEPEVLGRAKAQGKLILLYITAPWEFHDRIMADLTFSDPNVIRVVASSYVPVRVNTDHRPDLFARYGLRAWPTLTVLLPNSMPFFHPHETGDGATRAGGTFYTPDGLTAYFGQLADYYEANREMIRNVSDETAMMFLQRLNPGKGEITPKTLDLVLKSIVEEYGDRPDAPEPGAYHPDFPMVDLAFYTWSRTANREVLDAALHHLTDMVRGGIYDRLGGGFFRYAHDAFFRVPAFEKIPSINASAIRAYLTAYQVTGNAIYRRYAQQTLDYVLEHAFDRRHRCFLGAQAAWTYTGDNGEYYTWTVEEFRAALTEEEFKVASVAYDILPSGEMVDTAPRRNVIYMSRGPRLLAKRLEMEEARAAEILEAANRKLLVARDARRAPEVDRTTYGNWSGMMASALLHAAATLEQEGYAELAAGVLQVLVARCQDRRGLIVHVCDATTGEKMPEAFFADQVRVAAAFMEAYETTGSRESLSKARALVDLTLSTFKDPLTGSFADRRPEHAALGLLAWPSRELDEEMLMVDLLLRLQHHTGEDSYSTSAREVLEAWADEVGDMGVQAAPYALASQKYLTPPLEVLVVGEAEDPAVAELRMHAAQLYHPWRVVRHLDLASGRSRLAEECGLEPLEGAQVALCYEGEGAGPYEDGEGLGRHLLEFLHKGRDASSGKSAAGGGTVSGVGTRGE